MHSICHSGDRVWVHVKAIRIDGYAVCLCSQHACYRCGSAAARLHEEHEGTRSRVLLVWSLVTINFVVDGNAA